MVNFKTPQGVGAVLSVTWEVVFAGVGAGGPDAIAAKG